MIQYKCKSCGGQLNLGNSGSFECPYCGSKSFMSDADFKGNEQFRKKLLQYARAKAEEKEKDYSQDTQWEATGRVNFILADGRDLHIEYMFRYAEPGCDIYIARENVVYVFAQGSDAGLFRKGLRGLCFPEADTKLSRCFPSLKMELELKDGRSVLVFARRPGFYPAELFAPWPSEHLAWVISRMENICCALEYSELQFGGITPASLFVNPLTHEGAVYGDWRRAEEKRGDLDLRDLRATAIALAENTRKPQQLYDFLNTEPAGTAFEDFESWDKVIEEGFGGHKFVKM